MLEKDALNPCLAKSSRKFCAPGMEAAVLAGNRHARSRHGSPAEAAALRRASPALGSSLYRKHSAEPDT